MQYFKLKIKNKKSNMKYLKKNKNNHDWKNWIKYTCTKKNVRLSRKSNDRNRPENKNKLSIKSSENKN